METVNITITETTEGGEEIVTTTKGVVINSAEELAAFFAGAVR